MHSLNKNILYNLNKYYLFIYLLKKNVQGTQSGIRLNKNTKKKKYI